MALPSEGAEDACGRAVGAAERLSRKLEKPIKLPIKAIPGASRDAIAGWLGDALKIRVTAPAERGKANAAVERLVAGALGVPPRSARVVAGRTSARKLLLIEGLSESEVHRRLSKSAG
ncbi:MAG: DUF167 domain-containing protein [Myxococcota bacterium]